MGCCCVKEPKEDDAKEIRTPLLRENEGQEKAPVSTRNYNSTSGTETRTLEETYDTSQTEGESKRIDHIDKSFEKHEEQYGAHLDRHDQFQRTFKELSAMYPAHNPEKTVQGCFSHLRYSIIGSDVESILVINEDDPECIQLKYRGGQNPQTLLPILMSFNITSRLIKEILVHGPDLSKSANDLLSYEGHTEANKGIYEQKFGDLQKEINIVDDIQQETINSLEQLQEAVRILKSKKRLPSGAHDSGVEDIEVQCKPEVDQDQHESQNAQNVQNVPPIISVQEAQPKEPVTVRHQSLNDAEDNRQKNHTEEESSFKADNNKQDDSTDQQSPDEVEQTSTVEIQQESPVRKGKLQLEPQQEIQAENATDLEVQQIQSDPISADDVTSSSFSADEYRSAESPSTEDNYKSADDYRSADDYKSADDFQDELEYAKPVSEVADRDESLTDDSELTVRVQKDHSDPSIHNTSVKDEAPSDTSHGDDTLESDRFVGTSVSEHAITHDSDTLTETSYVGEIQDQETLPIRTPK